VPRLSSIFRNPFSFLFARSSVEQRVAAYVLREHDRGRRLHDILEDPFVRNRLAPNDRLRLLDRPEIEELLAVSLLGSYTPFRKSNRR